MNPAYMSLKAALSGRMPGRAAIATPPAPDGLRTESEDADGAPEGISGAPEDVSGVIGGATAPRRLRAYGAVQARDPR